MGPFLNIRSHRPSAARTLQAWSHPAAHLIQWERVLRWRQRTVAALARDTEPIDFLLVLFTNIFQMRDWMAASMPTWHADVANLFTSAELALARDLANGSKHMVVTSPSIDASAGVAREYAGQGEIKHVVPRPGGQNTEALPLADACIAQIADFLRRATPGHPIAPQ